MDGAWVGIDFSELDKALAKYASQGKNTRDVMRVISVMLVEEVDDMFETSGHGKWPPLAASTIRARGDTASAKLLLDTGRLAASITGAYTQNEAEAFTNVEYAKYHVSDAPRTKLPKRDFFDIDIDQVQREAADFLLKELTK